MDDIAMLKEWRSDVVEPDQARLAVARNALLAEAVGERTRRPRHWPKRILLPAAGLAAAIAITATSLVMQSGDVAIDTRTRSAAQLKSVSAGVSQLLALAATRVDAKQVAPPSADQWVYEETLLGEGSKDGLTFVRHETWVKADGSKFRDSSDAGLKVLDESGRLLTDENGVRDAGLEGDDVPPLGVYRNLQSLPSEPHQLLTTMSGGDTSSEAGRSRAFTALTGALRDAPFVPAVQHAAIFRAIALIPGVQTQKAQDAAGRDGLAIGRQDPRQNLGGRSVSGMRSSSTPTPSSSWGID